MNNHNLPTQLTSLVGREQEMATLHQLLRQPEIRLITIAGPGGVGKTSLALGAAHQVQDSFADGTFYVSLAPISDPTLIIPTIAQTLNLSESPRRLWLDSLKEYLHDRQVLLLLDNFEQIITAAPLLTELLSACARLKLLVTSREALGVRGEQAFQLSPLALPDQSAVRTSLVCPSIALFVQRAQAAQFEFRLTNENAGAVAEICARLDGLPLALELAAARIKLLPPQAMLSLLRESPLQLLTSGARDLPARQQTLRRAVQWSYDLLDEEEQGAFRWFSMFVGGSTLEAALTVLGRPTSLDVLDSLASKSLLRVIETNDTARLTMLETIREFGWEQLTQSTELEAVRRAHAAYYLSLAEAAEPHLVGIDQKAWLRLLEVEQDNLRAALHWAIEHHEGELAQRMVGALQPFWFALGSWSEGRRWLEEALALDSDITPNPAVHTKALYGAGSLARLQGDFARARKLCEQSLALYRVLADPSGVVMALVQLSRISTFQEDQTATRAFLAEAAALIDVLPDTVVKANAYTDIVLAMLESGFSPRPPEAAHYLYESERIQRALNNPTGLAFAILHQANLALFQGDDTLAESRFGEAERLATELADYRLLSRIALSRTPLDLRAGDFAAARRRLDDSLQYADSRGDYHLPSELVVLAAILQRQELTRWAAQVFGLAEARIRTGQMRAEVENIEQYSRIGDIRAEVRAQLGDEAYASEIAAGQLLTLDDLRAIPHPPSSASAADQSAPLSGSGAFLTAREREVLRLLDKELSNPQIADRLVVSRRTVDAHLRSIYDKLGVKSRDAAIRVAREQGMIGKDGLSG
jgi:predicted ATPase/DNA-binding CsgD family transcriptional regulator